MGAGAEGLPHRAPPQPLARDREPGRQPQGTEAPGGRNLDAAESPASAARAEQILSALERLALRLARRPASLFLAIVRPSFGESERKRKRERMFLNRSHGWTARSHVAPTTGALPPCR